MKLYKFYLRTERYVGAIIGLFIALPLLRFGRHDGLILTLKLVLFQQPIRG